MELERWHFILAGVVFIISGIILYILNRRKQDNNKKKHWRNFY